jgi:putative copper resistance protein D
MELALAAARALHTAALVVLFGELLFVHVVAPEEARPLHFIAIAGGALALATASALAWLGLEAVHMSGLPWDEALAPETIRTLVMQTFFGRLWLARFLLLAVPWAWLVFFRDPQARGMSIVAAGAAALLLASLAGMGHAAGSRGADGVARFAIDALHLLAAGAWIGMLAPLARTIARATSRPDAAFGRAREATRRFSAVGVASVGTLLLTGVGNVAYANGSLDAHGLMDLSASGYGRLLGVKLVLFAMMIALAAVNRVRLTPRLGSAVPEPSLRALRRNALAELVLGLAVVALAARLGTTMPPEPHHHHEPGHDHHHHEARASCAELA